MKPIVAGNWKMFGSKASVDQLIGQLVDGLTPEQSGQVDVIVCPPALYLERVVAQCTDSGIVVAGQNTCAEAGDEGAYTGEVSASMLKDAGCSYALVGHSERRSYYSETDERVAQKTQQLLSVGLTPIICIGETLEQRESGDTQAVIKQQLSSVLSAIDLSSPIVVAYEPVWAIGTGLSASPEEAQQVHEFIRTLLTGYNVAQTPILYGGSVKPNTAHALMAQPDVNGVLVGGASLVSDDFLTIIQHLI